MKLGDFAFLYHTSKEKATEVFKEYPHVSGSRFGLVDVKFSKPLLSQVTLSDVKRSLLLENIVILKQARLSIFPVSEIKWNEIVKMSDV